MKLYELIPRNGRKSFYGKAQVMVDDNGDETLLSYCTPIVRVNKNGIVTRLYDGELSMTTATHLKSFCGMTKADFNCLTVSK